MANPTLLSKLHEVSGKKPILNYIPIYKATAHQKLDKTVSPSATHIALFICHLIPGDRGTPKVFVQF